MVRAFGMIPSLYTIINHLANKMMLHINMLSSHLIYRVGNNGNFSTLIVTVYYSRLSLLEDQLFQDWRSQKASRSAWLSATYSASVVDRATVDCLLNYQVMLPLPMSKV